MVLRWLLKRITQESIGKRSGKAWINLPPPKKKSSFQKKHCCDWILSLSLHSFYLSFLLMHFLFPPAAIIRLLPLNSCSVPCIKGSEIFFCLTPRARKKNGTVFVAILPKS